MNNRYLYRAKRIDSGEWVEGYLMDENYINMPFNDNDVGGRFDEPIEVDPETICQYTGLNDENDRQIFEGDIFENYTEDEELYKVEWSEDDLKFNAVEVFAGTTIGLGGFAGGEISIIGNAIDNPELLNNSDNEEAEMKRKVES